LPVADVRQVVLDANTFAQGGAPFTRALSHAQVVKQSLLSVELDAASTLTAGATRRRNSRAEAPRGASAGCDNTYAFCL
jgi:hypothetical protein